MTADAAEISYLKLTRDSIRLESSDILANMLQKACLLYTSISLHYYTVLGNWEHKGSATEFDDKEYYITIQKTLHIADIIDKHLEIMDKYDPEHDISLIVDEWGTWYDVEPGTNPGFLYQQNTIRDAIVAAANLNIFNARCDLSLIHIYGIYTCFLQQT